MSLTLDNLLSGEASNSYVDIDYADEYWTDHYDSTKIDTWSAISDEGKTTLLILACRMIEKYRFTNKSYPPNLEILQEDSARAAIVAVNLNNFEAFKYDFDQKLQFPRNIDIDTSGTAFIPEEVKIAQCEQALYIKDYDTTSITKALSGIAAESVGLGRGAITKSVTYTGKGGTTVVTMLAPVPVELLEPLMLRRTRLRRA